MAVPRLLPILALIALAGCSADAAEKQDTPPKSSSSNPPSPSGPETGQEGQAPAFEIARSALTRDMSAALEVGDLQTFTAANTSFALDMHKRLAAEGGNVVYSPYSITTALAMVYAGARGETESEMAKALHFDLGQSKTHLGMNALTRDLTSNASKGQAIDGSPLKFAVNNALFAQKGVPFEQPFLDTLALHYDAGVNLADFALNGASELDRINAWVAAKTQDRIKQLLERLSPDTRFVLVNTVYMNAAWSNPFDGSATKDGEFTGEDGAKLTAKMMSMAGQVAGRYGATNDAEVVSLPYYGASLSMTAILPKGTLADFEKSLDAQGFNALLAAREYTPVLVSMPRVKIEGERTGLKDHLVAMGMRRAFGAADFSGITREGLMIENVVHKAFLEIGEKGTEAAAATSVTGIPVSADPPPPPKVITLNRPFFIAIRDEATGAILFTARVAKP